MGLAVLPARLKEEMSVLSDLMVSGKDPATDERTEKHAAWAKEIAKKYDDINKDNVDGILKHEIGEVFVKVLEDAGVYKCTADGRAAFMRFIKSI